MINPIIFTVDGLPKPQHVLAIIANKKAISTHNTGFSDSLPEYSSLPDGSRNCIVTFLYWSKFLLGVPTKIDTNLLTFVPSGTWRNMSPLKPICFEALLNSLIKRPLS